MFSKSNRNLSNEISGSLGLQKCNNRRMENVSLTRRTMDRERKSNLKIASPIYRQRRVIGRWRTLKSGVSSTKCPSTTPMNTTQNSHYWPSLKKKSQTPTQTLIWSRIKEIGSSMWNLVLPSQP